MAVGVGFEPTMACAITVFKTAAFVHSAIPPIFHSWYYLTVYIIRYLGYFVKLIFGFQLSEKSFRVFSFQLASATDSGATEFLRSIPAVHFASTVAACLEAAGVHGASAL